MKKEVNLYENLKLAGDMTICGVLLDIALAEPKNDKFTVGIMRAAKFMLLSGSKSLKDTSEAMSALIKAIADDKKTNISISEEELSELTVALIDLRETLQRIAETLKRGVKNHGNLI